MRNLTDIYVRLSDEERGKRCKQDENEVFKEMFIKIVNIIDEVVVAQTGRKYINQKKL